jgi:uncharacterized protein YdaU (DUF1376 family)
MIKEMVVSRTLLAHQYETMKIKEIMAYYGICCARLYKLLDEAQIPRKWDKSPRREFMKTVLKD